MPATPYAGLSSHGSLRLLHLEETTEREVPTSAGEEIVLGDHG
jgi:hypothetical protein